MKKVIKEFRNNLLIHIVFSKHELCELLDAQKDTSKKIHFYKHIGITPCKKFMKRKCNYTPPYFKHLFE